MVDRTESLSAAALEEKKKSRKLSRITDVTMFIKMFELVALYQTLVKHHQALKSLQKEHKKHVEREKALGDILDALRSKYNPNYQDMAVLEAVRGWEYYAGLPHINDVRKNEEGSDEEDAGETAAEEEEELEEGMWTKEQLEKDLDSLLNSNFESLLLEHENHIGAPTKESVRKLSEFTVAGPCTVLIMSLQSSTSPHTSRTHWSRNTSNTGMACCHGSRPLELSKVLILVVPRQVGLLLSINVDSHFTNKLLIQTLHMRNRH